MPRVAIYARYSDDKQSPFSIEDQVRICRMHADKLEWQVVETFQDAGISGSTVVMRPGVRALLQASTEGRFDIVLAEAMDRISRDQEDIAGVYKRLQFAGVQMVTLSEGEVNELHVGLKGTMNALFLKDLGAKTHRGIRGRVEKGKIGCGNAYGYRVVKALYPSGRPVTGERTIIAEQAAVVRRIFQEYVGGKSAHAIALGLNLEGIPAPLGGRWVDSSIRGDRFRGRGILNNDYYNGEIVWNRQRRMKNPHTGRRVLRLNPEADWVRADAPHLRIVPPELWQAAKARQEAMSDAFREAVSTSPTRSLAAGLKAVRRPKTLLSGLVMCGVCGGNFAKRSRDRYACVNHVMGMGCTNSRTVLRSALQHRVLLGLKDRLMAPEVTADAIRSYIEETNRLNQERRASESAEGGKLKALNKAMEAIVTAIEEGGFSRPLMARLKALEAEADALTVRAASADVPDVLPNVAEFYQRKVSRLTEALDRPEDCAGASAALRGLIDRIVISPGPKRGEMDIVLHGDLRTVLDWVARPEPQGLQAGSGLSAVLAMVNTRACRSKR